MGVPAFFKWLTVNYPAIVTVAKDEKVDVYYENSSKVDYDGQQQLKIPTLRENFVHTHKNNYFDNLYLDMNCIVHPCCHPEGKVSPKNEDEMFLAIFNYIDHVFNIVRPKKVLYMAIDGVAPRAKMNQQRSRRFRSIVDARIKQNNIENRRKQIESERGVLLKNLKDGNNFDSNCISPGTTFMDRLSYNLKRYINERISKHPLWSDIAVVFSDSNVVGEGEHKIMEFIRHCRADPNYDHNTSHCLYGADADLIMLGLATHEPHFSVLREEFNPNRMRLCDICGELGHAYFDCQGVVKNNHEVKSSTIDNAMPQFLFVDLQVLRALLRKELVFRGGAPPTGVYDFERCLDDWIFLCFFVGNDFLPNLPSLEIRENAIKRLVNLYLANMANGDSYLTVDGKIMVGALAKLMSALAAQEDHILSFRYERQLQLEEMRKNNSNTNNNKLKMFLKEENNKMDSSLVNDKEVSFKEFKEEGWKRRYYSNKFLIKNTSKNKEQFDSFRNEVMARYIEGLSWVMNYYFQGCKNYQYFYPFHYAPFASDADYTFDEATKKYVWFENLNLVDINKKVEPFRPLEQLMAIFPANSRSYLPESWQKLMIDGNSPIIDFYPVDFKIDLNGKMQSWQGVALLPFVNEKRLLSALKSLYNNLNDDEKNRNSLRHEKVFFRKKIIFDEICKLDPKTFNICGSIRNCDQVSTCENGVNEYFYSVCDFDETDKFFESVLLQNCVQRVFKNNNNGNRKRKNNEKQDNNKEMQQIYYTDKRSLHPKKKNN